MSKNMPPKRSNKPKRKPMAFRLFKSTFEEILSETPLPYGHIWKLQTLENAGIRNNQGWMEVLYRTRANYRCKQGHCWQSSWSMVLFRFHLDVYAGYGRIRMKRFGQRCNICPEDDTYNLGLYREDEVWETLQWLLLHIVQKCYEMRPDYDIDNAYYIIPFSDVPILNSRSGGGAHQKNYCEACAYDRCQEKYKQLTRKK